MVSQDIIPIKILNLAEAPQTPQVNDQLNKTYPYVYFGKDNLFPQYLVELLNSNPAHAAALNLKRSFIYGKGLDGSGVAELERLLKGVSVGEFLEKIVYDYTTFGGFYINVIWNRGGKLDQIKHVDYTTLRSGRIDLQAKAVTKMWMSYDWKIATGKRSFTPINEFYKPFEIGVFNQRAFREDREFGQIYVAKEYKPARTFYAEPEYQAAILAIEIRNSVWELHNNNLNNGMFGNTHIHLFADLSDDAKREVVERGLNKTFSGKKNTGKMILTWGKVEDGAPQISKLNDTNTHEMYTYIGNDMDKAIMQAHGINPILLGTEIKTGISGQSQAIRESYEYYNRTYVKGKQDFIIKHLTNLLSVNGNYELEILPFEAFKEIEDEQQ